MSPKTTPRFGWIGLIAGIECAIIIIPLLLLFATSFTSTRYLVFPPQGFTFEWYAVALADARFLQGTIVSLKVAAVSSILAVALGVAAARGMRSRRFPFAKTFEALFLAPLTIPVIVFSIGLLFFFQSIGLTGSLTGLIIAHAVHTFPYAVRMVTAADNRALAGLEQAAAVLGAGPWKVFCKVTLPLLRTGITAAFLFAVLISLNNVTIALFIAGSRTRTLPVVMFNMTEDAITPDLAALASILTVLTIAVMVVLEKTVGVYGVMDRRTT